MSSNNRDKDMPSVIQWDGTSGDPFKEWKRAILDTGAERTDESGSSVADVFTGADMGGTAVGAPPLPAGAAQHSQKMQALYRTRRKQAYALLVKNISCKDIKFHLRTNFFQQGEQAWQYLCSIGDMEPQRSDVRAHDAAWAKISIGADVGISGFTVTKLHSLLRRVNAERPPTHRHDESEIAVRLLECINENSKLFGAESLSEINSTGPHNGYFWIAGTAAGVGGVPPAVPPRRDLARLVAHYSTHWKNAFENGHLGPEQLPTTSGRRASSQSVGLSTEAKAAAMQVEAMQMEHIRAIVPRGAVTTTAFGFFGGANVDQYDCPVVRDSGANDDIIYLEDGNAVESVEIVCHNCRGIGHPGRMCPSAKKNRSFDYAIALLETSKARADANSRRAGEPSGGRRSFQRGQRPPFRTGRQPVGRSSAPRGPPTADAHATGELDGELAAERAVAAAATAEAAAAAAEAAAAAATAAGREEVAGAAVGADVVNDNADIVPDLNNFAVNDFFDDELGYAAVVGTEPCEVVATAIAAVPSTGFLATTTSSGRWLFAVVTAAICATCCWLANCVRLDKIADAAVKASDAVTSVVFSQSAALVIGFALIVLGGRPALPALVTSGGAAAAATIDNDGQVIQLYDIQPGGVYRELRQGVDYSFPVDVCEPGGIRGRLGQTVEYVHSAIKADSDVRMPDITVDSGASLTLVPEHLSYLITENGSVKSTGVKVASDAVLKITKSGSAVLPSAIGFTIDSDGKRAPVVGDIPVSRAAAVQGLAPDLILLSVRCAKNDDGIRAYFNDDNSYGVDECVRLPSGVFFSFGGFERCYKIATIDCATGVDVAASVTTDYNLLCHARLCHAGHARLAASNVTWQGKQVNGNYVPHECRGCRLCAPKRPASSAVRRTLAAPPPAASAREPLSFFGQLVASDCSYPFPRSFPHGFTGVINFCDKYTGDKFVYYLVHKPNSAEVADSFREFHHNNEHRLRNGKVYAFLDDNGLEYHGDAIDGPDGIVRQLIVKRQFGIANEDNTNPIAERCHGVFQHAVCACLAYADDAPQCLWPWAMRQSELIFRHLATTSHSPPISPRDFANPNLEPAELGWARVLFCNVTVFIPLRDKDNKISHTQADACHLGYDENRRCHFAYVPSLRRVGSYRVTSWCGENKFTIAKTISCDTPITYMQSDFPFGRATGAFLPKHFVARRPPARPAGLPDQGGAANADGPTASDGTVALVRRYAAVGCAAFASGQQTIARLATDRLAEIAYSAFIDDDNTEVACVWNDTGCKPPPIEIALAIQSVASQTMPDIKTVEQARQSIYWPLIKRAMEDEIHGKYVVNRAWDVVRQEPWMHVIGVKWVFTFVFNDDGSIAKVKARLVGKGFGQREGKEYHECFARTLSATAFRLWCAIVADEDLETDTADGVKAFTQADVDAEIYTQMPPGFVKKGFVLMLLKALEGIKQGSYLWFKLNQDALVKLGCVASLTEPNFYSHPAFRLIIVVFADDVANGFAASATDQYVRFKEEYGTYIKIATLDIVPISVFTGIEVLRDRANRTLTIRQTRYIERIAALYGNEIGARAQSTPAGSTDVQRALFDKLEPAAECDRIPVTEFLKPLGTIGWPAEMTRPDIKYFFSKLGSFSQACGAVHRDAIMTVINYLNATKHLGITYGGKLKIPYGLDTFPPGFIESRGLHAYHDASFGKAPHYGGCVVMFNNGAIDWSANKSKIEALSVAEEETATASVAAKKVVSCRLMLEDAGRAVAGPTPQLGDCKAVFDIIVKPGSTARTRYYERATMFVKRLFMLRHVAPYLVGTAYMIADVFTKTQATRAMFFTCRDYMLNASNGPGFAVTLQGQAARLWSKLVATVGKA